MPSYNFKSIQPVPGADQFVDVVLSATQRKTPTVIHPGYKIQRIRAFYMRKVKYTAEGFVERLATILDEFPRLDTMHPFYADLCNVLYDRDHYKLALGQLNICKSLMSGISRDYTRMLKYADTLYRCKQLKRAALGRMCTLMKKQKVSLGYLEEVRKHLSRLPSIDPNTRTLIVTGFPNVGKSSFLNRISNANVEVQPYAFTTKSIFVGHTDFKFLRWQVLDTPGILDKPLEERNTIEMQAITALAHLQSCVLYFVDLSETCGWSIEEQCGLFDNIRPLFANKPLLLVANKIDIAPWGSLEPEKREMIEKVVTNSGAKLIHLSTLAQMGIAEVKQTACEMLLEKRDASKMKTSKVAGVLNRITVTNPKPRDSKQREVHIPEAVLAARESRKQEQAKLREQAAAKIQKEGEMNSAAALRSRLGPGVGETNIEEWSRLMKVKHKLSKDELQSILDSNKEADVEPSGRKAVRRPEEVSLREHHRLEDSSWKHDAVPEIMDGKNIADFVDANILKKLERLEKEEDEEMQELQRQRENAMEEEEDEEADELDEEEKEVARAIREKKSLVIQRHREEKNKNRPTVPRKYIGRDHRTVEKVKQGLGSSGYDVDNLNIPDQSQVERRGRKRERSQSIALREASQSSGDAEPSDSDGHQTHKKARTSTSRSRSQSVAGRSASLGANTNASAREQGLKNVRQKKSAEKIKRISERRRTNEGRQGESDRLIGTKKPKHMYSGKRGFKADRR